MKNKKKIIIFFINIFIIVVSMSSFASAYEDYRRNMLNDAVKNMNRENKNSIIFSWDDVGNSGHVYKKEVKEDIQKGAEEENIKNSIIKVEDASVKFINTNYTIIKDNEGHRAIAYIDEVTNAPVIALKGFYIVKKMDAQTQKISNVKYYADPAGYLLSGWIKVGENKWYYLLEDEVSFGEVVTGDVISRDGDIYIFDEEGIFIGKK